MTAGGLLRLVLRRWYLMLLGAALSVAALYMMAHQPGVYWTQFNVVLLPPAEEYYPNKLEDPAYALGPMAGLVVADWNGEHRPMVTAAGDTPVFGEGLRQGAVVRLPNRGTQWQRIYGSPTIDVQVVGDNPAAVAGDARRTYEALDEILQRRQDSVAASKSMRITAIMSSPVPTVHYISGNRVRASAATGLSGAALTTLAVVWIDRWLLRSRPSRVTRTTRSARIAATIEQNDWA